MGDHRRGGRCAPAWGQAPDGNEGLGLFDLELEGGVLGDRQVLCAAVPSPSRTAESWRQATGTPVWGTPYGPASNEKGQPAGGDAIRAALATATR
jgi:hypothetical protein